MTKPAATSSVVIHGHFYQPPREDPWLEVLEAQPTATPHHDWNVRVEQECYRAVAAARILGPEGRIREILNTLELISFNFGPTLLQWMEAHAPQSYRAILEADQRSQQRNGGFGNALAQAYHHTILPLASRREKVSEVRWGMADFRRRFRREPTGMWLPETAVDAETLEVLAQEGIAFTILAPQQVVDPPKGGLPGLYRASGGKSVALFIYDGDLSHGVAFGSLLKDAQAWADRVASPLPHGEKEEGALPKGTKPSYPQLRSMATDGETYGHHHRFGEMALAKVLRVLQARSWVRVENFSSFLSRNPPTEEVELVEPSAWSCVHGVGRWQSDCGCKMDPSQPTQQAWREVLRGAMDWLAQELHEIYLKEAPPLLGEPWEARDEYAGEVARLSPFHLPALPARNPDLPPLSSQEETRARELLELERNALRLFTSCGWFFDDMAGLEPLQVLRYAARAMELAGEKEAELEQGLLARLASATTNEDPPRKGNTLYLEEVKPTFPPQMAVAAGALAREVTGVREGELPGFGVELEDDGGIRVKHRVTGREWLFGARVDGPSSRRLKVSVWPWGREDEACSLGLADLPEVFRTPVEEALREALLDRWIPVDERIRARRAGKTLRELVGAALETAVADLEGLGRDGAALPELREDDVGRALDGIQDLADLHQLLGLPIPFDAQTNFHRILEGSPSRFADRLLVLQDPLGFVQT